jgi:23S rRNA (adenine2030-N6)-methyltransferase
MNYRHAYHAGNFADVMKHAVLARILAHLTQKDAPIKVIDTHAGLGIYDLAGEAARRTGEADGGVKRLEHAADKGKLSAPLRALLAPYREAVRRCREVHGAHAYPGSPEIARELTRAQDRLLLVEKHPTDAAALAGAMTGDRRVKVLAQDGWIALGASVPPPERRGVVLIDPPFEEAGEFGRMAQAVAKAWRKWRTGTFVLWYPIKDPAAAEHFAATLAAGGIDKILRLELLIRSPLDHGLLNGSGLLVINPPWTLAADGPVLMAGLGEHLGVSRGAFGRCTWLVAEAAPAPPAA